MFATIVRHSIQMVAQSKNGHIAELHVLTSAVLQW